MNWRHFYEKVYEIGGDATILVTQFLSDKKWIETPDTSNQILTSGTLRYRIIRNWCKANPRLHPVNNCHEMVIDSQQRLYLVTDNPANNVIVFDLDGEVLDSWTLNLKSAHGLTLTSEPAGEYLWLCDPYSGRVIKTTLHGEIVTMLPSAHDIGIYKNTMPYMPTQTAVAPNGDVYVADGYGSQYVLQFSSRGEFIRQFGGKGKQPHSLDFAHGVAIDTRCGAGKEIVLVTSRKQSRIAKFNLDGNYLGDIPLPGGYPCRPVIHEDKVLIGLCWSGAHMRPNSGFVIMLDADNKICLALGGQADTDANGNLSRLQTDYSCFHHVHDVCADTAGNLYVCQWNAGKIYPIKLELL